MNYRYFVSYAFADHMGSTGFGRVDFNANKLIENGDDLMSTENHIKERSGFMWVCVLYYRLYDTAIN